MINVPDEKMPCTGLKYQVVWHPYGMVHANISSSRIIEFILVEIWCDYIWLQWLTIFEFGWDEGRLSHPNISKPTTGTWLRCFIIISFFKLTCIICIPSTPSLTFGFNTMKLCPMDSNGVICGIWVPTSHISHEFGQPFPRCSHHPMASASFRGEPLPLPRLAPGHFRASAAAREPTNPAARLTWRNGMNRLGYDGDTLWWTNIAMENGHRNSGFSHEKWWFFIAMLVHQRVSLSSWKMMNQKLWKGVTNHIKRIAPYT